MSTESQLDPIGLFFSRWRTVAIFVLLGGGISSLYALFAPPWYEARLTVVPPQPSRDAGLMPKLAALGGLDTSISADVERINTVFRSNSVADQVIDHFDLRSRYGKKHIEQARTALWEHCNSAVDRRSGVVSLTCEDKDPKQAMAMADFFGEVGNLVMRRISASSASEERRFLEQQVVTAKKDIDEASKKLREFQEQHKIVDLPEQSKAVISAMASIKGELVSKQLQLSYLTGFSSRTESNVVQIRQQIDILERKLAQLESATTPPPQAPATNQDPNFFPDALRVPALRFELEQLYREQKIYETVYGLMTQRYEMSKVDEARDTSSFQILDHPTLPTYKARPRFRKSLTIGLFGSLVAAGGWIFVPFWWRRRLARP